MARSMIDKATGRIKQALGDLTGRREVHREGAQEELKGEKAEELEQTQERVEERSKELGEVERQEHEPR